MLTHNKRLDLSAVKQLFVRIWKKIPLTLREQRKDPFKHKLQKLLIKVLETKKVYVDISTITSSYLNSLFG